MKVLLVETCNVCGAGTFTSVGISSTECVNCVKGKYQDNSTKDKCFDCPIGWYQQDEKKPLARVPG